MVAGLAVLALTAAMAPAIAHAQISFVRITDSSNPIVSSSGSSSGYDGASWIDYDNDGDLDLYVSSVGLFRNDGGGLFVKLPNVPGSVPAGKGNTWADVDGDGYPDAFIAGGAPNGSGLWLNHGGGNFTRVIDPPFADTTGNSGWGCAFGDYDHDGRVDLVVAAPFGFAGINHTNRLFHNLGGGAFERVDTTAVTAANAPYTVPTWSDFDGDGDMDLFIGSGPANGTLAPDFLYRNRLEVKPGWLQRMTEESFATDVHDGQVYNWVDIDNDGDLDLYVTDYGPPSGIANELYRNNGDGTFTKLTGAQAGPIVTDIGLSLASCWGDYDNDGDLDCLVTNDAAGTMKLYSNDGHGFFTSVAINALTNLAGPHWGATNGDFDGDGDLDLYVSGPAGKTGLYRCQAPVANHWLELHLVGRAPNTSAIGARVRVLATIGGAPRWQMREISAENSFDGQNALDAHLGLGAAAAADSVTIDWPDGSHTRLGNTNANTRLTVLEDVPTPVEVSLVQADARPDRVVVEWQLAGAEGVTLAIQRSAADGAWGTLGTAVADGEERVRWVDAHVTAGARYGYRVLERAASGDRALGETWVTVPSSSRFAIVSLTPNPSDGVIDLAFSATAGHAVTAELLDLQGRRVEMQTFAPAGGTPTTLHARFGVTRRPPAGLYLARLWQDGRNLTAKVVVTR